jgi:hypothetical protein
MLTPDWLMNPTTETPPPADRFRLGDVWRSPRLKDWTVDKIDNGLARLRSVAKPKNTQWRGVRDTGRDMTTAWYRVSPSDGLSQP